MKKLLSALLLAAAPFAFASEQAPRPSLVVTAPVTKGTVNPLQRYAGTLYYDKQSKLASEFEGVVGSVAFREGERIRRGATLVHLDSRVLEANIAARSAALQALQADLTRQERDLERTKALFERNSISQSGYDQVFYTTEKLRAQADAAAAELKALRIQLEKRDITAPFNAVAATRDIEVGEWVGKGATVATLVDPASIEARLNVPARLIDTIKKQKRFAATVEGRDIEVTLKTVIPVADAATRTFPIELSLPESAGLIEGMRIDVSVPTLERRESLMVPRDAVIKRFGQTVVFTAVGGKAVMYPVQVIGYDKDMAAIDGAGLKAQMRVVTKGNERIFPNMPVAEKK
jgi:membrane fusion protein (multidrug efflux system)